MFASHNFFVSLNVNSFFILIIIVDAFYLEINDHSHCREASTMLSYQL